MSRGLAMRTAFCCLMFLAGCAAAQTVEGIIVDSVTGTGIPAVFVFLQPAVAGDTAYDATTDARGHFLFDGVKTGAYQFGYTLSGYLSSYPRQIQVSGGGNPVKLEGRMTAQPRISGRVMDGDGKGIANALLGIIGQNAPPITSDATGKFEMLLEPGTYFLSVLPPTGLKPPDPEPNSDRRLVWARTFYPGVARLEAASKIVLRPGSEVSGIVIRLLAVPSHAVRGVLFNPDGTPAPTATITLGEEQEPASGHPMFKRDPSRTLRAETNSDGAFEFPQVADGEWRLAAQVDSDESGGQKRRATQWIDMEGHQLEGVKLRLASPFTVRGQVIVETPKGLSPPDPFPVFLVPHGRAVGNDIGMSNWMLWPIRHFESPIPENAPFQAELTTHALVEELGAILATPDRSGNFTLEDVYPGSYRIVSTPPPPPYYMAAVRVGETGLTTAEVNLSPGAAPITVVYKTNGGTVRGTAEKCAAGIVILIPQDPAMQSLPFLRSVRCDVSDRYEITAVRPGGYYTLALAEPGGVPQLDDILISQSGKVTVHADETASADLRAIQRPGN
jgi:hypothetical protein